MSNTLVHERSKVSWVLKQVAPFRVITRPRFSRDNFRQGHTLSFESRNFIADLNQHVEEKDQIALPPTAPCPGMTIVLSATFEIFASAARIWPSMLPPVE